MYTLAIHNHHQSTWEGKTMTGPKEPLFEPLYGADRRDSNKQEMSATHSDVKERPENPAAICRFGVIL